MSDTFRQRYFKMAKEHDGTSGGIMDALSALAREQARQLLRSDRRLSKKALADQFEGIAAECYAAGIKERWENDYALDISDNIRRAVMSVRV